MRERRSYDAKSPKQTVSITLNSDLYSKAKQMGINASQVAEQAIADEYDKLRAAALRAELAAELAEIDAFEAEHGSFADMMRDHDEGIDGAV